MTEPQGEIVIQLLAAILERLDAFAGVAEEPDGCSHPEDQRVSLSSYGDPHHWVCRLCKFDNKSGEALEARLCHPAPLPRH